MKTVSRFVMIFLIALAIILSVGFGQVKVGVDVYSRYIFRGYDYGNSPSFQPSLSYSMGDFSVGVWGAYGLSGTATSVDPTTGSINSSNYAEADIWASYSLSPITLYLTDYYIPTLTPGVPFFNYNTDGKGVGAHIVELGIGYTGPETFPLSVTGYVNVTHDTSNSVYIQASYPIITDLSLTIGFTPMEGAYTPVLATPNHPKSTAGLVSVGFSGSKTIKVTEDFSIPFNAQYIMNPYAETAYLIFGINL